MAEPGGAGDEPLIDKTPRDLVPGRPPVGPLALGAWRMTDAGQATATLEAALVAGMNLVDTADVYGLDWGGSGFGANEEVLGGVLAARPDLREQVVLATKGGIVPGVPYDSSDRWLRQACDDSRRRLQTDVLDLYLVHRPDLFTSPHHLADTLHGLVERGAVRSVGVSNMTVAQVDALGAALGAPVRANQVEVAVDRLDPVRDGTLDRCLRDATVLLAWSPLGGGRLATGDGVRPELVAVLDELAAREGVDRSTIALAFVLALPGRPVAIVGSQDPGRLAAAARAVDVRLTRRDAYRLVEASEGVPLP
jgi:predicted oxidoreductase